MLTKDEARRIDGVEMRRMERRFERRNEGKAHGRLSKAIIERAKPYMAEFGLVGDGPVNRRGGHKGQLKVPKRDRRY